MTVTLAGMTGLFLSFRIFLRVRTATVALVDAIYGLNSFHLDSLNAMLRSAGFTATRPGMLQAGVLVTT